MPSYRIHRIKDAPGENFRWSPHTGGEAIVKLKDYAEATRTVDAATPYAAWKLMADANEALRPGDLLEILEDALPEDAVNPQPILLITKYIGFDPAKWFVPEPKGSARSELPSLTAEAAVLHSTPAGS